MVAKKGFIVEPHYIVVFDMMAKMLGPDVGHCSVAGATDPAQETGQLIVVTIDREHGVVGTFMDHVSGDDHAVSQEQYPGQEAHQTS